MSPTTSSVWTSFPLPDLDFLLRLSLLEDEFDATCSICPLTGLVPPPPLDEEFNNVDELMASFSPLLLYLLLFLSYRDYNEGKKNERMRERRMKENQRKENH